MIATKLLVFGPKPSSCDWAYLKQIRLGVAENSRNRWILDDIKGLLILLHEIQECTNVLKLAECRSWLQFLIRWFETGDSEGIQISELPNIVVAPLVVIAQLTEYTWYSGQVRDDEDKHAQKVLELESDTNVAGFCIGILSAIVVACSSTWAQLRQHGSAAIRLSMAIGAVVDAQESDLERSVSLFVSWRSKHELTTIKHILETIPDAYFSVRYDENQATITVSRVQARSFETGLQEAGIRYRVTHLYGRYHTQRHRSILETLIHLCQMQPSLQLPLRTAVAIPTYLNKGDSIDGKPLHEIALQEILVDFCDWHTTCQAAVSELAPGVSSSIITFGHEACIPPSVLQATNARTIHASQLFRSMPVTITPRENDIAVVGFSCNVPGAQDLDEFWSLLVAGKSQHREVDNSRFTLDSHNRSSKFGRKWYGNFLDDYDAFDHKFFHKSQREAASMDPQQRLLCQAAYQAVAQSGYFQKSEKKREKNVGCYIGVCSNDYDQNVSQHEPNAFSATGNLRAFVAGKVSHYFGWYGPSLTVDTACSSSTVAIHQACQAILSGDCQAALAGGTNFLSSPLLFQNLAAGSFLSPTGQCKPFDIGADGYCRGEAVAVVFLKKMTRALLDHDLILGTIASTAVFQNENCTPIFVPNISSLSSLFDTALEKAGVRPEQLSLVEAHGTGTIVGDKAEYASISKVFGHRSRLKNLQLGSVKGLLGHTEASSGIVSLVKVLLMMNESYIPPQPSFKTLNPSLQASAEDGINISSKPIYWQRESKIALINNYGASGTNASIIVKQAPPSGSKLEFCGDIHLPIYISATDQVALKAQAFKLERYIKQGHTSRKHLTLQNLAFNLHRQSNRDLSSALIFSSSSLDDVAQKLATFHQGHDSNNIYAGRSPEPRPVILCFGGQTSRWIGLDPNVYEQNMILRSYLDKCHVLSKDLGAKGIYPSIFKREPIDIVSLQLCLFSLQYSCAMSWISCGIEPVVLMGYSFGELTALCVAGILSLEDTLQLVIGRSNIVESQWGAEKGSMMAVEGDLDSVRRLLSLQATSVSIACFNGPRSFTLVGTTAAITSLSRYIADHKHTTSIRCKILNVSHAFHSVLVDALKPDLERLGKDMRFRKPEIQLEWARQSPYKECIPTSYVYDHAREPVYWDAAVQRVFKKHPSAVWIEAGSNSTITAMASRAIQDPKDTMFQSINITSDNSSSKLIDATLNLWRAGIRTAYWAHAESSADQYDPILLPPYQFCKYRHWLDYRAAPTQKLKTEQGTDTTGLLILEKYLNPNRTHVRFRINVSASKYREAISGHSISKTAPICPLTLQLSIALEAIMSLQPDDITTNLLPQISNVKNQSPLCDDASRLVLLEVEHAKERDSTWAFKVYSCQEIGIREACHTTGEVRMKKFGKSMIYPGAESSDPSHCHEKCLELLNSSTADYIIQGSSIYRAFSSVVDYGDIYRGVQKIVGKDNWTSALVVKDTAHGVFFDTFLSDCFCQVAGIWINCMFNDSFEDIYVANGIREWVIYPGSFKDYPVNSKQGWHVLAHHTQDPSGNAFSTNILVFEPGSGELLQEIRGITFTKIPRVSMVKILKRHTSPNPSDQPSEVPTSALTPVSIKTQSVTLDTVADQRNTSGLLGKLKRVISEITGLRCDEIPDNANMADIGIDSLIGMELANDIESAFGCTLSFDELLMTNDLESLLRLVHRASGADSNEFQCSTSDVPLEDDCSSTRPTLINSTADTSSGSVSPFSEVTPQTPITASLSPTMALECFSESKLQTDHFIREYGFEGYVQEILPKFTVLSTILVIQALKTLGCDLSLTQPGQTIERISYAPGQGRFQSCIYKILEDGGILDLQGERIVRTEASLPSMTSTTYYEHLIHEHPDHKYVTDLVYRTGSKLADILIGKEDGVKLLFGTEDNHQLLTAFYAEYGLNRLYIEQMTQFIKNLVARITRTGYLETLRILEMGAGSGGTTRLMLPVLVEAGIPVEYTFTDLSPSSVAKARKQFKQYPFVKFAIHDIEHPPSEHDMFASQHIVIASNAVHATRALATSARNIHKFLRPDGFLMMLEMTQPLHWVDIIFGSLKGWWLFDDGRTHALVNETQWARDLREAGYGHVDWTDGIFPESKVQRLIIAIASDLDLNGPFISPPPVKHLQPRTHNARKIETDAYIQSGILSFSIPTALEAHTSAQSSCSISVLITGATGSLGCHLVAHLANLSHVSTVYCINRRSSKDPMARQLDLLSAKGIFLGSSASQKLKVFETDTSKPLLGLPLHEYQQISKSVHHIIHNAWPMYLKSPIKSFEPQFATMRNLLDLAAAISGHQEALVGKKVSFQFISSIATVGHYPIHHGTHIVPEESTSIESVLCTGYAEAKFVCERMLEETIARQPERFRAMIVRLGQVAGSSNGYWNNMEHIPFILKSSQRHGVIPSLNGSLSWTPVNEVAGTLVDLLLPDDNESSFMIYHVDNPVRQPWPEMIAVLAEFLGIPPSGIVPFQDWLNKVREFKGLEVENPAAKIMDFLAHDFEQMSCAGLILDLTNSLKHSQTLRQVVSVDKDAVRRYIQLWKQKGFLC